MGPGPDGSLGMGPEMGSVMNGKSSIVSNIYGWDVDNFVNASNEMIE